MRLHLFIFLLLFASYASAQSVVAVEEPGKGFRFAEKQTGKFISQIYWDEAEPFVNGFSRVLSQEHFAFVDARGLPVCNNVYVAARNFSNKLAAVKNEQGWGFINESGKLVIPCSYEIVYDFKLAVTAAYKNRKWFLVNTKGEILATPDITACYGFVNGMAVIEKNGITGTMNTAGVINFSQTAKNSSTPLSTPVPLAPNQVSQCPDNIDFEFGSFQNWRCFTGRVDSVGNTNVITVTPSAPTANRHTLYNRTVPSAIDPFGLFPTNPPDGSNFAVKLGNTRIGAQAERIQYRIQVPANDSNFSVKYDYAVVFEDPGHTNWTQPRFTARLFDSVANAYVTCASFEYISTSGLPGFARSTVDTAVIFKPWSSVYVSLRGYAGKTMFLEFTTADCVRKGHWGYAYVDVEKPCGQSIQVQYDCTSPNITNLSGPPGFQVYNWWDSSFTILYSNGQNVVLNPGPTVNSTIWLEMIPFNDFGCRDTIPVKITGEFNADFSMSDTVGICAPHTFSFYNSHIPSLSANWNFGDGTTATGDTVTHTYPLPGNYTVTLQVVLPSGCIGTVVKIISVLQPVGSFYFDDTYYCNSSQVRFDAVVSSADSLFWDFGDGNMLATTLTTVFHSYALPGVYMPVLTVKSSFGCQNSIPAQDTIRIEKLRAAFFETQARYCGYTNLTLTDSSYSYFGINTYAWDFGDGTTGSGSTVNHQYTVPGTYQVQLIITGISGCADTISKPVHITINPKPSVSITGPAMHCGQSGIVFNALVQASDSVATLQWSASNGTTGTGSSFSSSFTQPGNYNVMLVATTIHGCTDTAYHSVNIMAVPDLMLPSSQSLCSNALTDPVIYSGSVNGTIFNWTNNNTTIGLAATGSGNISSFTAINNTSQPVTATISAIPVANGCTGNPQTFTITVNPLPDANQPADMVFCKNAVTSAIGLSGSIPGTNVNWTNNNTQIGLAASGTGNIPSFTAINNTTLPVTATITVIPELNGCAGPGKSFTITVNPMPAVTVPAGQRVCNGAATNMIYFASAVQGAAYTWTNSNTSIGLAASGTGNIAGFTAINNSNVPDTAVISVFATADGCQGPVNTLMLIVDPSPVLAQPVNQQICNGAVTGLVVFNSTVAGTSFTWINNNSTIGLPASGSGDIPSFTAINGGDTSVTATVIVTPTGNGCLGEPKNVSFTVFPTATIHQLSDMELCNGTPVNAISFVSSVSGASFTWSNNNISVGVQASGTGTLPAFTAMNATNLPVTATITVSATANACPGPVTSFHIKVNPTPALLQPGDMVVCNGIATQAIHFTGNVPGTNYKWVNNNPSIGLPASGTGDIPSFIAVNDSSSPVIATITVTPTANNCPGAPKTFTITVKASPEITQLENQQVCNGAVTSPIVLSSTINATVYGWTNNNPAIGLASSGSGDIGAFTAINLSNAPVVSVISVSATAYGCSGKVKSVRITVHPTPKIHASADMNVCQGRSVQLSANGAVSYSWSPSLGLNCDNCPNPVSTPADSVTYIVNGTSAAGCTGRDTVSLTLIRPFDMLVDPGDTICIGESLGLKAMQARSYTWTPSIGLSRPDIPDPVATPQATTRYRVVGYDGYNCFTDTGYVLINVGPKPTVNIGADMNASTGTVFTFHPSIQNGPIVSYLWSPATELSCSDCETPTTTAKSDIEYTLTVRNNYGCEARDVFRLQVFCTDGQVFIPNAFTPNGDGLNDILMVRGKGITVKTFRIFNRWGELVFERKNFSPNDPRFGWDGKVRGVTATPDVFVYTADVVCDNDVLYTYKGNTTVLK